MLRRVSWFQSCHPLCCRRLSLNPAGLWFPPRKADFALFQVPFLWCLPSLFSLCGVSRFISHKSSAELRGFACVSCIRHHKQGMITQHFPFIATMCRFSPTCLVAVAVGHFDQHQSGVTHHCWLCLSVGAREWGDGCQSETLRHVCSSCCVLSLYVRLFILLI